MHLSQNFMAYYKDEATAIDYLIAFLFSCRSIRIMNSILWERVSKRRLINKSTFDRNLSRLKEKGVIKIEGKNIGINHKKLKQYYKYRPIYSKPEGNSKIIIIFDIPEKSRKTRDWLRNQIKLWGFTMIQKSVWLGVGPLPEDFHERIKMLGVKDCIKVFNVEKKTK
jgi:DNA-binding transcriptional regulator PaaX